MQPSAVAVWQWIAVEREIPANATIYPYRLMASITMSAMS